MSLYLIRERDSQHDLKPVHKHGDHTPRGSDPVLANVR